MNKRSRDETEDGEKPPKRRCIQAVSGSQPTGIPPARDPVATLMERFQNSMRREAAAQQVTENGLNGDHPQDLHVDQVTCCNCRLEMRSFRGRSCRFCEKTVCEECLVTCFKCGLEFCPFCSSKCYLDRYEVRGYCLSCRPR